MSEFGIIQSELLKKSIPPGTKLKLIVGDRENGSWVRTVTVVEEYKNHVLLDFGKYRESRRKVDIALKLGDVVG